MRPALPTHHLPLPSISASSSSPCSLCLQDCPDSSPGALPVSASRPPPSRLACPSPFHDSVTVLAHSSANLNSALLFLLSSISFLSLAGAIIQIGRAHV